MVIERVGQDCYICCLLVAQSNHSVRKVSVYIGRVCSAIMHCKAPLRARHQPHMYTILVVAQCYLNMKHLLLWLRALDMVQALDFACHRTLFMISDHLDRTFRDGMITWRPQKRAISPPAG